MKEIREAVNIVRQNCYLSSPEIHNALLTLLALAEKVLAVKMPEKKGILEGEDVECFTANDMNRAYNQAIDDCRIAITGALLSEEELIDILNTLVHPTKKLPGTTVYCVPREVISTIATAIHSAQVEKLMGKKYKIKSIVGDKQCMEELKYPYQILESVIELEEVEEVKEVEEKWNENVEECSDCGIKWKKIGKSCPVCFAPAENEMNNSPKGLTGRGD